MNTHPRFPVFRDRPVAALIVICLSVFVISVDTIVRRPADTVSRTRRRYRSTAVDHRCLHPGNGWPAVVCGCLDDRSCGGAVG